MSLTDARAVADAVLYEGYLLYPYRSTSAKNQLRWQFGVLGPPGAAEDGIGDDPRLATQCLLHAPPGEPEPHITVHLRFLQLQHRSADDWDEAVEHEVRLPERRLADLTTVVIDPVAIAGGNDPDPVGRTRWPLAAEVRSHATRLGDYARLSLEVQNRAPSRSGTKDEALRTSLIGTHLLIEVTGRGFVSLLDPPADAESIVAGCRQHRCWPVLAGPPGTTDVVLASPIIVYDHPEVAPESAGALFDSTEIDEILTLRVLTMTEEEKTEARATDPRAAEIVDRCENMTPEELQRLHGALRSPHTAGPPELSTPSTFEPGEQPWWDPAVDEQAQPEVDAVVVDGRSVSKGSLVRLHPSRRADAQDLFFADQVARVTAVLSDVDGGVHVAVVLADDPAADLHDWYGRYLYFAPDELEPLPVQTPNSQAEHGKENPS